MSQIYQILRCYKKKWIFCNARTHRLRRFVCGISSNMATLETLDFDNLVLRRLPIDSETTNYVRTVRGACFSKVSPTPVDNPVTVACSASAMSLLDLPQQELERGDFTEYFCGNKLLPGSETAAHCYCGHQFGYFAGQLGDGAAMYLGEVVNGKGERWEIQLKGAGLTPYSRSADGRKVLRSSVREFLCSEAMHFLGVPTTRAGACITSDSEVVRDIFYDGHPIKEKCTIVLRIAPTFLRFGSFEIFKTMDQATGRVGPSIGREDILITMLDYSIETFYPEIHRAYSSDRQQKYANFFKEVVLRTARLVALWQCVGFCHGVLNTDNMSILGLTLDYGPFGFMDLYDPDHICNGSDDGGRYTFIKQPEICLWNLRKLAEAIQMALPQSVSLPLLDLYEPEFMHSYLSKMREKLGFINKQLPEDSDIIESLLDTMKDTGADFTNTFRCLSISVVPGLPDHPASFEQLWQTLVDQCYPVDLIVKLKKSRVASAQFQMFLMLHRENPGILDELGPLGASVRAKIARLEEAEKIGKMTSVQKKAQDEEKWTKWLDMYKQRLEQDVSEIETESDLKEFGDRRRQIMNSANPRYILRNYIAQHAISLAEKGDYSEVRRVLKLLEMPYAEDSSALDDLPCDDSSLHEPFSLSNDDDGSLPSTSGARHQTEERRQVCDQLPPTWAFALRVT